MVTKRELKSIALYCFCKRLYFRIRCLLVPKQWYAKWTYYRNCHKWLNINIPQTYDEHLWWLKFNYHNPLQTQCADKCAVRDYVRDCGLEDILIESYGTYRTVDDINLDDIPAEKFFLKCNHLSGGNMICRKDGFNRKEISKLFASWMKDNAYYYGYEWPYKDISPRLLTERVLCSDEPYGLLDYKFFCFEGEPRLLSLDIGVCNTDGSHAEEYYRNFYDMEFHWLDITETRPHYKDIQIPKPENFSYMVDCARRLSKPFPHCRVDLYNVKGKVYFGEITFYHGSGYNDIQPHEADLMMGNWIDINRHRNIAIEHTTTPPYGPTIIRDLNR